MIALARKPNVRRPRARPFEVGQAVRLDWPKHSLHGMRGTVRSIDGDQVGVVWHSGECGVNSFYQAYPARRLRRKGGRR